MLVLLEALPLASAAALCAAQRRWWAGLWCGDALWVARAQSRLADWLVRAVATGEPLVGLGAPALAGATARERYRTLRYTGVRWLVPAEQHRGSMAADGSALHGITAEVDGTYVWERVDLLRGTRHARCTLPALGEDAEMENAAANGRTLVVSCREVNDNEQTVRVYRLSADGNVLLWHHDFQVMDIDGSLCVSTDGLTVVFVDADGTLYHLAWPSDAEADAYGVLQPYLHRYEDTERGCCFMSPSGRTLLDGRSGDAYMLRSDDEYMLVRLQRPGAETLEHAPINVAAPGMQVYTIDDNAVYLRNGRSIAFDGGHDTAPAAYPAIKRVIGRMQCAVNGPHCAVLNNECDGITLTSVGNAAVRCQILPSNCHPIYSAHLAVCARGRLVMCQDHQLYYTHL